MPLGYNLLNGRGLTRRFAPRYDRADENVSFIISIPKGNINIFSKKQKILKKVLAFFRKV